MEERRKVIVFGTFDGVHEGHRDFFRQAAQHGDITAVVARDNIVEQLKKRGAQYSEDERLWSVKEEKYITNAVFGDTELSVYRVIEEIDPDIICLGYDQNVLKEDVRLWVRENRKDVQLIQMKPYYPEKYHTSIKKKAA